MLFSPCFSSSKSAVEEQKKLEGTLAEDVDTARIRINEIQTELESVVEQLGEAKVMNYFLLFVICFINMWRRYICPTVEKLNNWKPANASSMLRVEFFVDCVFVTLNVRSNNSNITVFNIVVKLAIGPLCILLNTNNFE